MAASSAWLALPRPVAPDGAMPLPAVDRRAVQLERAADHQRVERARAGSLPYEVRAVGELVRRYGVRQARGDAVGSARAREDAFRSRIVAQQRFGAEALRSLRAVQTELFLSRVRSAGGRLTESDRELAELAGDLPLRARRAGWTAADGRLALAEDELTTLFRVRWTDLVGALHDVELAPKLDELRSYYRVLLVRPEGSSASEREERRLVYAEALGERDPSFAGQFVRGVSFYRLGRAELAAGAFLEHLRNQPDGAWSLRARNHLLAMLAESGSLE
jgi:hypothetical protein